MDVTRVAAYSSIIKDLSGLWSGLQGDDKARLDAVLKKVVKTFVPTEGLERQKRFFLESTDVLPMKIAALVMDPEVRKFVSSRVAIKEPQPDAELSDEDMLPMVKCRHCGSIQILDELRRIA